MELRIKSYTIQRLCKQISLERQWNMEISSRQILNKGTLKNQLWQWLQSQKIHFEHPTVNVRVNVALKSSECQGLFRSKIVPFVLFYRGKRKDQRTISIRFFGTTCQFAHHSTFCFTKKIRGEICPSLNHCDIIQTYTNPEHRPEHKPIWAVIASSMHAINSSTCHEECSYSN